MLQRISKLKKQAAVAHNPLSRGKPPQNMSFPIQALANLHVAPAKLIRANSQIHERLIVVVPQNGRVGHASESESLGIGVRVIADGAWGFAASADLSPASLTAAVAVWLSSIWIDSCRKSWATLCGVWSK